MVSAKEYFFKDISRALTFSIEYDIHERFEADEKLVLSLSQDVLGGGKWMSIYLPHCNNPVEVALSLNIYEEIRKFEVNRVAMSFHYSPDHPEENAKDLTFTKRWIIYTPQILNQYEKDTLINHSHTQGLRLVIHDGKYLSDRSKMEKPLAFISHDSRDKDEFVRDLANRLQSMACPVWYDEYSLNIGDSLRESIEKGIKDCKKCIVVLSPNFLSNSGWTKTEFNAIFTKELIENKSLILPVWHNVDKRMVYEYSPTLANILAVNSSENMENVSRKLYISLNKSD